MLAWFKILETDGSSEDKDCNMVMHYKVESESIDWTIIWFRTDAAHSLINHSVCPYMGGDCLIWIHSNQAAVQYLQGKLHALWLASNYLLRLLLSLHVITSLFHTCVLRCFLHHILPSKYNCLAALNIEYSEERLLSVQEVLSYVTPRVIWANFCPLEEHSVHRANYWTNLVMMHRSHAIILFYHIPQLICYSLLKPISYPGCKH